MSNLFWENKTELAKVGVKVPVVDIEELANQTEINPQWVHFGGGNLFRAFHAEVAQELQAKGELKSGLIVCETYDEQVIDEMYQKYNNGILEVIMHENGELEKKLLVSTAASYFCHPNRPESFQKMQEVFQNPTLQLVTVTITEKGYALKDAQGNFFAVAENDITQGPEKVAHTMGIVASLLLSRYQASELPIAMVTTDNFSKNGQRFQESVVTIAQGWVENGFAEAGFVDYLNDAAKVSFPWSMIDRITPNPSETVAEQLQAAGIENIEILHTVKHTNIATFANTEATHYLVIEDNFPNGRPELTEAGVILTDRETVDKTDAMKVTTCLNPLHTALAVYGCVLGYDSIAAEMKDSELVGLIKGIGYTEGLPVVEDPKIIDPKKFIDELITKRLPNPMIPDTPQRIATDTSQKVGIRFGETIAKYMDDPEKDSSKLKYIPLAIAGWLRYLVGIDDDGKEFVLSPDPLLAVLQEQMKVLGLGKTEDVSQAVESILENTTIFGVNLYDAGIGEKIEGYLTEMLAGEGAVRATLKKYVTEGEN